MFDVSKKKPPSPSRSSRLGGSSAALDSLPLSTGWRLAIRHSMLDVRCSMFDVSKKKPLSPSRSSRLGGSSAALDPRLNFVMFLNCCLNHSLARPLDRFLNRRLDGRRCRQPNYLAQACTLIEKFISLRRKMARAEPHLFGPHAGAYYRDTLKLEAQQKERDAALEKVYGPAPPGSPRPVSVWSDRYYIPPESMKIHRKWFRENYGD